MSKPAIYPDDLAELCKSSVGKKYQPSNGTEGEYFFAAWCIKCAKFDFDEGCEIHGKTTIYSPDDEEYPQEWQYGKDGQPECTAFATKQPPDRDTKTNDIFKSKIQDGIASDELDKKINQAPGFEA